MFKRFKCFADILSLNEKGAIFYFTSRKLLCSSKQHCPKAVPLFAQQIALIPMFHYFK